MNKELVKIIKKMDGSLLGIGLSEKITSEIEQNKNITKCDLLTQSSSKEKGKIHLFKKTFKINKLRKKYKKKKLDYIICDYKVIEKYLNTFVKDSVYINKKKLIFYNVDYEIVKVKYKRYNSKIEFKNKLVVIDNSNSKTNWFKDWYYRFIDFKDKLIDIIGEILMG